jgi:ADP-heptose:LPS heptosyltransferase
LALEAKLKQHNLPNLIATEAPSLRELLALVEVSSIAVSPDSLLVHACGCWSVPCIGVWGPISPVVRTCYYRNHIAIWHKELCYHAPCFCYTTMFPYYCPPTKEPRTVCSVLGAISSTEVIEAIQNLRR